MYSREVSITVFLILICTLISFPVSADTPSPPELYLEPSYSNLDLQIEENVTLRITVQNNLNVLDEIELKLSDSGGSQGDIDWGKPEGYNVTCTSNSECTITLGPGESTDALCKVEGIMVGPDSFFVDVKSSESKLTDKEYFDVFVSSKRTGNLFSAPEISFMHILALAIVGSLVILFYTYE